MTRRRDGRRVVRANLGLVERVSAEPHLMRPAQFLAFKIDTELVIEFRTVPRIRFEVLEIAGVAGFLVPVTEQR